MSKPLSVPIGPIRVNSDLYQLVLFRAQRCACGASLKRREETVLTRNHTTIRRVKAVCAQCRSPFVLEFDITGCTSEPRDRARFLETITRFLDGISAYKRGELEVAGQHLVGALANEPNFTVGHFYLGKVRLAEGRTDSAIRAFRHAVKMQPMELSYQEALYRAYVTAGEDDQALAALATVEDVRLRVDQGGFQPRDDESGS